MIPLNFFQCQGPRDLQQVLMISWHLVSIVNGVVVNLLKTPVLSIFLKKFKIFFFKFFENYYQVPSNWMFISQRNYLKLKIGILKNLVRQWTWFADLNILNLSKILLNFAIIFKICEYFCPFLSLTTITGQRRFSSLLRRVTWNYSRDKIFSQIFIRFLFGWLALNQLGRLY